MTGLGMGPESDAAEEDHVVEGLARVPLDLAHIAVMVMVLLTRGFGLTEAVLVAPAMVLLRYDF